MSHKLHVPRVGVYGVQYQYQGEWGAVCAIGTMAAAMEYAQIPPQSPCRIVFWDGSKWRHWTEAELGKVSHRELDGSDLEQIGR